MGRVTHLREHDAGGPVKFASKSNKWGKTLANGLPWASGQPGTTITPGASNTYGGWVQLIDGSTAWAADDSDGCQIELLISGGNVSGQSRNTLLDIGVDLSGGTSYTVLIAGLVCGPASNVSTCRGAVRYIFPIRIPRGASVGARGAVNNGTAGSINVAVKIRLNPKHPELIRVGKYVRTFGVDTPTSAGTAVALGGGGAKGSYVQLGSAIAAGDDLWHWQLGVGYDSNSMNNNPAFFDLAIGDASNKEVVCDDVIVGAATDESLSKLAQDQLFPAVDGQLVYARGAASSSVPGGTYSCAAYAVGG